MPVNRSEIVRRVASIAGLTDREAATALNAVLETIVEGLEDDYRIEVRGFGSFNPRQREPRQARNPKSGEPVQLEARKAVHFKAGKKLIAMLNGDLEVLDEYRQKQEQRSRQRDENQGQLCLF